MPGRMLRMIAVAALYVCDGALAVASGQPRHGPASAERPAAYQANRLSTSRAAEPTLNIPGQTTVLTRELLDDMKATSVRDALRSTAGVTVGR